MEAWRAETPRSTWADTLPEVWEAPLPTTGGELLVDLGSTHSIRLPVAPGSVDCPLCGRRFEARGPTGHLGDEAICDLCLVDGCAELGMVLVLVSIVRRFGELDPETAPGYRERLVELGAFSRVYERFAARSGPPRDVPVE